VCGEGGAVAEGYVSDTRVSGERLVLLTWEVYVYPTFCTKRKSFHASTARVLATGPRKVGLVTVPAKRLLSSLR